jgi:putative acetyltransferase
MIIAEDDLSGAAVAALLREHLDGMTRHSPPESIHALDLSSLRQPGITFWTAWESDELLGCAALKELSERHGEIKSMRTAAEHLGRGVASSLLTHIIEESNRRSYTRLSLETGSGPAFDPAHSLYLKFGFEYCGPFGDYREDPFSRFMTLELTSGT